MELKVLVDNNTYIDRYFFGEPAVSYYIETADRRVLFDTGYSDILLKNAEKMNVDLKKLTHIILSHGHNDHSRGLKFLSDKIGITHTSLIAHPDCFLPKYDGAEYIGSPYTAEEITCRTKYLPGTGVVRISEDLIYLGEIPRTNDFEMIKPIGKQKISGILKDDYVMDDTALVYKNSQGIFIITGCSHSGICNIIQYARKVCREDRILGILGGFHLFDDDERLRKTIRYLENCNIGHVYPCHCVSLIAKSKMMEKLPVTEVGVGMTLKYL